MLLPYMCQKQICPSHAIHPNMFMHKYQTAISVYICQSITKLQPLVWPVACVIPYVHPTLGLFEGGTHLLSRNSAKLQHMHTPETLPANISSHHFICHWLKGIKQHLHMEAGFFCLEVQGRERSKLSLRIWCALPARRFWNVTLKGTSLAFHFAIAQAASAWLCCLLL